VEDWENAGGDLRATMLVSLDQALLVGVGLSVVLDMIHDRLRVSES
jgi:hypothetical protein